MNPIFTKTDLTKTINKKPKKNIKTQIDSVSDDDTHNDVCIEQRSHDQCEMILDINDIMKTIPNNAINKPDCELGKTNTEWRWRFFNVKGRKLIEISKKNPNHERMYVNNTGSWINYNDISNKWDKFLVRVAYHYAVS